MGDQMSEAGWGWAESHAGAWMDPNEAEMLGPRVT